MFHVLRIALLLQILFFSFCNLFIFILAHVTILKEILKLTNYSLKFIYNIPRGNKGKVAIYQTLLGISYLKTRNSTYK